MKKSKFIKFVEKKLNQYYKKQLSKNIELGPYASLFYGSEFIAKSHSIGLLKLFEVFNVSFQEVYGEYAYSYCAIQGVSFSYDKENDCIITMIETNEPGLIIGKMGCFIEALSKSMSETVGKKVEIRIKERREWFSVGSNLSYSY